MCMFSRIIYPLEEGDGVVVAHTKVTSSVLKGKIQRFLFG